MNSVTKRFLHHLIKGESCWTIRNQHCLKQAYTFATFYATDDPILVDVKNGVRKITLNRPQKKNAMNREMIKMLVTAINDANEDEKTTVVSVTGTGEYFTSGIDLTPAKVKTTKDKTESTESKSKSTEWKKGEGGVSKFVSVIAECKKPLIALVNGPAMGFGVTFLGLFDNVYASDKATFHTTFTKFALPPEFASTYTFPRIMGYGKASNLLLFNQKMNGEEALACGLVSRLIPHQQFPQKTAELLETYGQLPQKSLKYTKELIRGREQTLIQQVSQNEQSHFDPELAKKVIMQFMENKKKAAPPNVT